jgi:hypothetical protein
MINDWSLSQLGPTDTHLTIRAPQPFVIHENQKTDCTSVEDAPMKGLVNQSLMITCDVQFRVTWRNDQIERNGNVHVPQNQRFFNRILRSQAKSQHHWISRMTSKPTDPKHAALSNPHEIQSAQTIRPRHPARRWEGAVANDTR